MFCQKEVGRQAPPNKALLGMCAWRERPVRGEKIAKECSLSRNRSQVDIVDASEGCNSAALVKPVKEQRRLAFGGRERTIFIVFGRA